MPNNRGFWEQACKKKQQQQTNKMELFNKNNTSLLFVHVYFRKIFSQNKKAKYVFLLSIITCCTGVSQLFQNDISMHFVMLQSCLCNPRETEGGQIYGK